MRAVPILLTLAMLYGCATAPPYKPFKVEREQIIQEVRTIGLMGVSLPGKFDKEDQIMAEFESYITEKLTDGGFQVIPSKRYAEIYESMKASVGQLYDPNTGQLLKEKHDALVEHAKREYRSKYDPDALLYSLIRVFKASWSANRARWHGVDEPTTGKKGFWADVSGPSAYGTIPGLSLVVVLRNPQENEYYVNFGGIQLLQWVKGRDFVDVPQNQLLADSERNRRSVEIALAPLLGEEEDEEEANEK